MYLVFRHFSKTLVLLCSVKYTFFSMFPQKNVHIICSSLASKFIVEIDNNAIAVIYVDLISCLLKVECYFFKLLLRKAKNIVCTVINTQRVRQIFIA